MGNDSRITLKHMRTEQEKIRIAEKCQHGQKLICSSSITAKSFKTKIGIHYNLYVWPDDENCWMPAGINCCVMIIVPLYEISVHSAVWTGRISGEVQHGLNS